MEAILIIISHIIICDTFVLWCVLDPGDHRSDRHGERIFSSHIRNLQFRSFTAFRPSPIFFCSKCQIIIADHISVGRYIVSGIFEAFIVNLLECIRLLCIILFGDCQGVPQRFPKLVCRLTQVRFLVFLFKDIIGLICWFKRNLFDLILHELDWDLELDSLITPCGVLGRTIFPFIFALLVLDELKITQIDLCLQIITNKSVLIIIKDICARHELVSGEDQFRVLVKGSVIQTVFIVARGSFLFIDPLRIQCFRHAGRISIILDTFDRISDQFDRNVADLSITCQLERIGLVLIYPRSCWTLIRIDPKVCS